MSMIDDLREALAELVEINERHNDAVHVVIQRPVEWKDTYLDKARAALAKLDRYEVVEGNVVPDGTFHREGTLFVYTGKVKHRPAILLMEKTDG